MPAVRYRFQVTTLDGTTELPADDDFQIVADGGFGQFLVRPTGVPVTFAALGLIPIGRLLAKQKTKRTGIDGVRVQAFTVYDDGGTIAVGADIDAAVVESAGTLTTPVDIEAIETLLVADVVRRIIPGWPVFGSTSRVRFAEGAAATTFWQLILVLQDLPEDACCLDGIAGGAPPP